MCHCYGKITTELVPIRTNDIRPISRKLLSYRQMHKLTGHTTNAGPAGGRLPFAAWGETFKTRWAGKNRDSIRS